VIASRPEQATLADLAIPARRVFVAGRAYFEPEGSSDR
jgi:hypothetical protein